MSRVNPVMCQIAGEWRTASVPIGVTPSYIEGDAAAVRAAAQNPVGA